MPHVDIKHFPGWTEEQKIKITNTIVNEITSTIGCSMDVISVCIESIEKSSWKSVVYDNEINNKKNLLYKKPNYNME